MKVNKCNYKLGALHEFLRFDIHVSKNYHITCYLQLFNIDYATLLVENTREILDPFLDAKLCLFPTIVITHESVKTISFCIYGGIWNFVLFVIFFV